MQPFPAPGLEGELQLARHAGVLLLPERQQRLGQPAPLPLAPVDDRVTGGTKGNQRSQSVTAGAAVMDGALIPCPAALTGRAVAGEHGFAAAAEAPARVGRPLVAAAAQAGKSDVGPQGQNQRGWSKFCKDQYS